MILLSILDFILDIRRQEPNYKYELIHQCRLKFYGDFYFNKRRWRVYQIYKGIKFRMPSAQTTFRDAVLAKYGIGWGQGVPLIDLDNAELIETCFGTYEVLKIELYDTNFVMFG